MNNDSVKKAIDTWGTLYMFAPEVAVYKYSAKYMFTNIWQNPHESMCQSMYIVCIFFRV